MRTLPPPPVSRCDQCGGELRLKGIEPDGPRHELVCQKFICINCDREKSYQVGWDPYASR